MVPFPIDKLKKSLAQASEDHERMDILLRISSIYLEYDMRQAISYARKAMGIADALDDTSSKAQSHFRLGVCFRENGQAPKALDHLTQAYRQTLQFNPAKASIIEMAMAGVYLDTGEHAKALSIYFKGLKSLEVDTSLSREKVVEGNIYTHTNIAMAFIDSGDFVSAMDHACKALRYCHNNNIDPRLALIPLKTSASICYLLYDYERAFSQYQQALNISIEYGMQRDQIFCLLNLGRATLDSGNISAALNYQRQAWKKAKGLHTPRQMAFCQLLAGTIYYRWKDYNIARKHYINAEHILTTSPYALLQSEAKYGLSLIDREEGKCMEAIQGLQEVLSLIKRQGAEAIERDCHRELTSAYEKNGNPAKALFHHKRFHKLHEQLSGLDTQREIARMQIEEYFTQLKVKLANKEKELALLSHTLEEREKDLVTIALSLAQDVTANKKSIKGKKAEKETSLHTLKNRSDSPRALPNKGKGIWKPFEHEFDLLHPNFIPILTSQVPSLTPTELRICRLLRAGLVSKEIAETLSISPQSVKVYRHRIRKKLDLPRPANLVSYINSI